ncbi:cuticular protein 47Eg-like [Stomoxys calcitrans]|uniref:cuticular protein 47Eg-like n=1 Tax=Stomoxys calcitrans TaxID=35570 RepID=UPI0027E287EE|nr:cuticular protein 47Eg-like [Stomoxys calcitrans]
MKLLIALTCILAVVAANENANVLRNDAEVNVENFKYALELDNSVNTQQEGSLNGGNWVVKGSYKFTSPEGEEVSVQYTADENGYHVDAAQPVLPTPPPIPEHILKAIKYIEEHTK